jgi:hypothetical protein
MGELMLYAHTHQNDYFGPHATFALTPPAKSTLEECFKIHANQIIMLAGLSVVSKHDVFEKKIGREIAEQRVTTRVAEFTEIMIYGTKHVYKFVTKITVGFKEYKVHFDLTTVAESDEVKLIKCDVYE